MNRELELLAWERAGGICEYCRMPQVFDEGEFEIDHIIAQQHDGPTIASNLCVACFGCNHYKGPNLRAGTKSPEGWLNRSHRCPDCKYRTLNQIDHGVFYDPAPIRRLFRCKQCGAEFVRLRRRWMPRSEWKNVNDQKIFDELERFSFGLHMS